MVDFYDTIIPPHSPLVKRFSKYFFVEFFGVLKVQFYEGLRGDQKELLQNIKRMQ